MPHWKLSGTWVREREDGRYDYGLLILTYERTTDDPMKAWKGTAYSQGWAQYLADEAAKSF